MNKKQLLVLSLPVLLLSSCGKSVVVYLEPSFESYKSETTYDDYTAIQEEKGETCTLVNDDATTSFSMKLESGAKEIKTTKRDNKEIVKATTTEISKTDMVYDNDQSVGKADSVNEKLVDGKELDNSSTTTVNNYTKVDAESYVQETTIDGKRYVVSVEPDDKTYSKQQELDDTTTMRKYMMSVSMLLFALSAGTSDFDYTELSDEEKAKAHFYVDDAVFTETYATSIKEEIKSSSDAVVGKLTTTLDYKTQFIIKEDSFKVNFVQNKKEVSNYTADYSYNFSGDEVTVETNTYAQFEIKKDDVNLGAFNLSNYVVKE